LYKMHISKHILLLVFVFSWGLSGTAVGLAPETAIAPQHGKLQQRIDFGNAYIMGQSIKSGAVYLLHRKQSDIKSMLKLRTNYRLEIKEDYALENTELGNGIQTRATKSK